jgi:hypothetical protein
MRLTVSGGRGHLEGLEAVRACRGRGRRLERRRFERCRSSKLDVVNGVRGCELRWEEGGGVGASWKQRRA